MESSVAVILAVLSAVILISVIVAIVAWLLTRTKKTCKTLLKKERKLFNSNSLIVQEKKVGTSRMGQSYALSLWLYIFDFKPSDKGKLIFMRRSTNENNKLHGVTPIVFLDASTNKLHICALTNKTTGTVVPTNLTDTIIKSNVNRYINVTIDYVPMQRWCNVTMVVQDYMLSVYLDGSLYAVESIYDAMPSASTPLRPLFEASMGDAVIGNDGRSLSSDVHGYVSNVKFMSYAPTIGEVERIARSGPTDSAMQRLFGSWFRFSDS